MKSGKSTFINKVFKECNTNNSYNNSTIGLNLYTMKDINNFAILDSPGDTEISKNLKIFASKGYLLTKLLVYIINEENELDADSLGNNKNLDILIESLAKYKIPLLIFLTHCDTYCEKVKKEDNNWKQTCKEHFDINELLENQFKCDFKMNENDIMHIVLLETNSISDEELIKRLNPRLKEKYDKGDQKEKSLIIESVRYGMESTENEVNDFLKNELKVLGQKELIEIMKLKLPSQFHNALN